MVVAPLRSLVRAQRVQAVRCLHAISCHSSKSLAFRKWRQRSGRAARVVVGVASIELRRHMRTKRRCFDAWRVMTAAQVLVSKWHQHLLEHHRADVHANRLAMALVFRGERQRTAAMRVFQVSHGSPQSLSLALLTAPWSAHSRGACGPTPRRRTSARRLSAFARCSAAITCRRCPRRGTGGTSAWLLARTLQAPTS